MHDPLLHKVKASVQQAKEFGKKSAIEHVSKLARVPEDVAESFYETVKDSMRDKYLSVNMQPDDLLDFLQTGKLPQVYSERRKQIEKAIGASPPVTFAFLSKSRKGNIDLAPCSLLLAGVEDSVVVVSGDSAKLRNPVRRDYAPDPSKVLYDWDSAADAMAASACMALGPHELSGGLPQALSQIKDETKVFGPCHVLVTKKLSPSNVRAVIVPNEKVANEIRMTISKVKRILPVEADGTRVYLRQPYLERERDEKDSPPRRDYEPLWILEGDEVAFKPTASSPQSIGKVVGVKEGRVSVQWADGDRTIFDLQEALARLMPAPHEFEMPDDATVYSLGGVDEDSVKLLLSSGIDPVDLHAVAHTFSSPGEVEEKAFREAMADLGVGGEFVDGFAEDEDSVYVPSRWFEANLPFGNRLVIDLKGGRPKIAAGKAPEYVLLPEFTDVPIE